MPIKQLELDVSTNRLEQQMLKQVKPALAHFMCSSPFNRQSFLAGQRLGKLKRSEKR